MITSNQNPLIKELQLLQKKKKERNSQGVFIVEGLRAVREIPKSWKVDKYVTTEEFAQELEDMTNNRQVPVLIVANHVFETISDTKTPQGIMAVVSQIDALLQEVVAKERGFYIIADRVQDPGNLGTIIRTAHGAGVDGIFLSKGCVDLYNPKVVRATMGSIFHVPIFSDLDMEYIIKKLINGNTSLYATALDNSNVLYDYDFTQKLAIIIGNEANGVGEEVKSLVSNFIRIPMPGHSESLNASMAAGICMFEVVRQRING